MSDPKPIPVEVRREAFRLLRGFESTLHPTDDYAVIEALPNEMIDLARHCAREVLAFRGCVQDMLSVEPACQYEPDCYTRARALLGEYA